MGSVKVKWDDPYIRWFLYRNDEHKVILVGFKTIFVGTDEYKTTDE
jgi:hypothetical protein